MTFFMPAMLIYSNGKWPKTESAANGIPLLEAVMLLGPLPSPWRMKKKFLRRRQPLLDVAFPRHGIPFSVRLLLSCEKWRSR